MTQCHNHMRMVTDVRRQIANDDHLVRLPLATPMLMHHVAVLDYDTSVITSTHAFSRTHTPTPLHSHTVHVTATATGKQAQCVWAYRIALYCTWHARLTHLVSVSSWPTFAPLWLLLLAVAVAVASVALAMVDKVAKGKSPSFFSSLCASPSVAGRSGR